jgi:tRNA U34 2-thiouridine synthase MnmA/TrmU
MHGGARAGIRRAGSERFEVEFREPVHAAAPGQAAVVYVGGILVGGGFIESAR